MDSLKSIVVVAILLGVLYGIYQVINEDDSPVSPMATNLLAEFDKNDPDSQLDPLEASTVGKKDDYGRKNTGSNNTGTEHRQAAAEDLVSNTEPPPSKFDPSTREFVYPKKGSGKREDNLAADNNTGFQNGNPELQTERTLPQTTNGIYRPGISQDPTSGNDTRIIQTGAESNTNDPRNRFVTGSFAKFEKQVLNDMKLAETLIKNNDFSGALKTLSKFFDDPRLTREENQNLVSWLDPLAGKVIYSVEHHMLDPYYVRQNDTLNLLSVKFGVPAELIFNINRVSIPDPKNLVPGTELKMIKGPFNAEISISKKKMTLFVNGLYAGTFSVRIGTEPVAKPGKYRVLSKSRLGQDYSDLNYQRIAAQAPQNPYGKYYLNIGAGMAIHGSAQVSDSNDRRGCISLNAVDSEDVHNILTTESTVTIVE